MSDITTEANTRASADTNLQNQVNSLNSSVSNGKNQVANAITGKGVAASGSDSFATLANKINQIQSLTTIDRTARSKTSMSGSAKVTEFGYYSASDLNLYYGGRLEYGFGGCKPNGLGNWDAHSGYLYWSTSSWWVNVEFRANYNASTLSGAITASTNVTSSMTVKDAYVTTYNGHPATTFTIDLSNMNWYTFGPSAKTAVVTVYCTKWQDSVRISGTYILGTVAYLT